ncbi:MAG: sulfotransferase family 2 domain-containing protein [Cyanobacteria bacterium P01_G01_bin.49]
MLISFEKKILFIHIPKNAGTSLKNLLSPFCLFPYHSRMNERLNRPFTYAERHFKLHIHKRILYINSPEGIKIGMINADSLHHAKATDLQRILGNKLFNSLFKFAFVRNPWAKEVSDYEYIKRSKEHPVYPLIHSRSLSFEQYLEWKIQKGNNQSPQLSYIADRNNNLLIDFVGKVENINQDIKKLSKLMNLELEELPKLNSRKQSCGYQELYNSHSKKLVEQLHKNELELFDYSF